MTGTLHEIRHILKALPDAVRRPSKLPREERAARLRGVPLHLVELAAIGALRFVPPRWYLDEAEHDEGARVLVLHGYAGHPYSHGPLRRHLHRHGFRTESIDLRGHEHIPAMADEVVDWLQQNATKNDPVAVVAHSLGGVVARYACKDAETRSRIERMVTLGSPHEGTPIADLVDTEKASELERDAELTDILEQQEPWGDNGLPRLICLWSPTDLVMVPPEVAVADGAEERELEGMTHYGYMLHPRAWRAVVEALRA